MNSTFPATSRYFSTETASFEDDNGESVRYLKRRFVPPSDRFVTVGVHLVSQGDRLDNVTARYLSDPEQFWRLCDANGALRPDELTETVGLRLRITLPEGIPGMPNV